MVVTAERRSACSIFLIMAWIHGFGKHVFRQKHAFRQMTCHVSKPRGTQRSEAMNLRALCDEKSVDGDSDSGASEIGAESKCVGCWEFNHPPPKPHVLGIYRYLHIIYIYINIYIYIRIYMSIYICSIYTPWWDGFRADATSFIADGETEI